MSGRSPGLKGPQGGARCMLILQRCLAIHLQKVSTVADPKKGVRGPPTATSRPPHEENVGCAPSSEYWMYDSGYLIFQGFLEANLKCFWNASLLEAMKLLEFQGYVAPGVLLVTASACALEVVRAAWARNVLKPPSNYVICVVGDIEDCLVQPISQGQFTPLPEALCWVILDLTSSGQSAVLENIRSALQVAFPDIQRPSSELVYDSLAKLMADRKIYQTSQGYFVVTPEKRRRDGSHQRRHSRGHVAATQDGGGGGPGDTRALLMSTEEALTLVHGEVQTFRDGEVTHQSIQTNLADVICGGNPNDKILYARSTKRSSSFPLGRLERRHSLRLFGSSKRLSASMSRSGSMRHIPNKLASDSSSSTEYPSTDCSRGRHSPKKASLLSRLFRRGGHKRGSSAPPAPLATFSAQFPPSEWFNPRVVHLHSVATQTRSSSSTNNSNATPATSIVGSLGRSQGSMLRWTDEDTSSRAATLPRRHHHRRHDSATSVAPVVSTANSTPRSSRRNNRSPSLPGRKAVSLSRATSRSSVVPPAEPSPPGCKTTTQSPSKIPSKTRSQPPSNISPAKAAVQNGKAPAVVNGPSPQKNGGQGSPTGGNKNSVTLQVSTTNCNPSPPSLNVSPPNLHFLTANRNQSLPSSGYSSQCQSSCGRGSVMSTASSATPSQEPRRSVTVASETPSTYSTTTTTTINGSNTKIYVQQQNSPVRSVITFENGVKNRSPSKDIVIVNNGLSSPTDVPLQERAKVDRPTSLYSAQGETAKDRGKFPSVESINGVAEEQPKEKKKLNNNSNMNNRRLSETAAQDSRILAHHPNSQPPSTPLTCSDPALNNARVVANLTSHKESLSYKNLLKDNFASSPTDGSKNNLHGGSFGNLYNESSDKLRNGHESTVKSVAEEDPCPYASLSDLTVHFKSIAAQKILQGVSINSIDTLVEVNMAAAEKQNNCDVTIHTDFGLV